MIFNRYYYWIGLNDELFHWQTQSGLSDTSQTTLRYKNHKSYAIVISNTNKTAAAWLTKETLYSVAWLPTNQGLIEKIEDILENGKAGL